MPSARRLTRVRQRLGAAECFAPVSRLRFSWRSVAAHHCVFDARFAISRVGVAILFDSRDLIGEIVVLNGFPDPSRIVVAAQVMQPGRVINAFRDLQKKS